MTAPVLIGAGVLAFGVLVVVVAQRGPLRAWATCPIGPLRRGHLVIFAVMAALPACGAMVVSLAGRVKLNNEIRDRISEDTSRLKRDQLTVDRVAGIAQAQARLERPSERELLLRVNRALKACASDAGCRVAFVQTVNRIIRSPAGRSFTVAPPDMPVVAPPEPTPPVTQTVVVPPPPATPGKAGAQGPQGPSGAPGKPVDSAILDGLDNRLVDVEHGLARVVSALCVPALVRLLHLIGVCA